MRGYRQKSAKEAGFTIVELMIASAVFTTVLTIAIGGFVQVSRVFYKGITITQAQQNLRDVMDGVAEDIRAASSVGQIQASTPASDGTTRYYLCIGSSRYTWMIGKRVDLSSSSTHDNTQKFGLLLDHMIGASPCGDPYNSAQPGYLPISANASELLNDNTRLNHFDFSIMEAPGHIYYVNVGIAKGRDSFLKLNTTTNEWECNSNLSISQFCAVTQLATYVAGHN